MSAGAYLGEVLQRFRLTEEQELRLLAVADHLGVYAWDESKHPRAGKGSPIGGRWVTKDDLVFGESKEEVEEQQLIEFEREQVRQFREFYNDYKKNAAAKSALTEYVSESLNFNSALRKGKDISSMRTMQSFTDKMDQAFTFRLQHDVIVFRGIGGGKPKPGQVYRDKAYVSTSMSAYAAAQFGTGTVMEIRVPKGTRVALASPRSKFEEWEVILPRGSGFKVEGKVSGRVLASGVNRRPSVLLARYVK